MGGEACNLGFAVVKRMKLKQKPDELRLFMWVRAQYHIPAVMTPLMFLCAFPIITRGWNTEHYHLFECFKTEGFDGDGRSTAVLAFVMTLLVSRFGLMVIEVTLLHRDRTLMDFVAAVNFYVVEHVVVPVTTLVSVGLIFTSCWLIKHDGLGVLEHLTISQCG